MIGRVWLYVVAAMTIVSLGSVVEIMARDGSGSSRYQDEEQRSIAFLRDRQAQSSDPIGFVRVIERLGEMRSVAAIDDLINLITFKRTLQEEAPVSPIQRALPVGTLSVYPATGALFHIGEQALPALTAVIKAGNSEALASENAFYTVMAIFREDREAGVEYLESAANHAHSAKESKKLLQAAERAKSFVLM